MTVTLLGHTPLPRAEELVIVGTGSGSSILKALVRGYTRQNPSATVTVPPSIGSAMGIKSVGNDEYIVGRVARDISSREEQFGLTSVPFARMPIVFFVNSSVSLREITSEQACRIYDGTIRRWDELDGGKGKIRVIRREEGDSSLMVLLKTVTGFADIEFTTRAKTTFSDPITIAETAKQNNAIAYGTWPNIRTEDGVHPLKLNGVGPSDPDYLYVGQLSLIFKEKNLTGTLRDFIGFLSTPEAREIILAAGALPVE